MIVNKIDASSLSEAIELEKKINGVSFSSINDPIQSYGLFDDSLIGVIDLSVIDDEAEVLYFCIDEEKRGNGYSKILFNFMLNKINAKKIFLEVSEKNNIALNLYKSLGFKETGIRREYYKDLSNAITMEMSL